jgi:hypothetical protein
MEGVDNDNEGAAQGGGEEEDETPPEEDPWNAVFADLMDEQRPPDHKNNLQVFVGGVEQRQVAQERLGEVFAEVEQALNKSVHTIVEVTYSVYEEAVTRQLNLERELVQLFGDNHAKRQQLIEQLKAHDSRQRRSFYQLMGRVHAADDNAAAAAGAEETFAATEGAETGQNQDGNGSKSGGEDEKLEEEVLQEPDWEALVALHPSAEQNVQLFLESRDRWMAAQQHFADAIEEIHDSHFKRPLERLLQSVMDACDALTVPLDELQADIQDHMVSNFQRRREIQRALEEVEQRRKSVFASLMNRILGGTGKRKNDVQDNYAAAAQKPRTA